MDAHHFYFIGIVFILGTICLITILSESKFLMEYSFQIKDCVNTPSLECGEKMLYTFMEHIISKITLIPTFLLSIYKSSNLGKYVVLLIIIIIMLRNKIYIKIKEYYINSNFSKHK